MLLLVLFTLASLCQASTHLLTTATPRCNQLCSNGTERDDVACLLFTESGASQSVEALPLTCTPVITFYSAIDQGAVTVSRLLQQWGAIHVYTRQPKAEARNGTVDAARLLVDADSTLVLSDLGVTPSGREREWSVVPAVPGGVAAVQAGLAKEVKRALRLARFRLPLD
eukprot:CAMPEP_0170750272 /NCGR_PEP_ID=MMETSP0437-20130122/10839_1 /TAXON_ID=0 /ORGANISM="Sexangularia sp." /LENGTH=168 /DNA_ID=CAMNT_0011089249 /DNA_START=31 /DNA_END=537 /DNA_ORIENTATION=+